MALRMPLSWTFSTHVLDKFTVGPTSFVWFVPHASGLGRRWGNESMTERGIESKRRTAAGGDLHLLWVLFWPGGLHGEQREGPLPLMDGWKLSCQD